MLKTLAALPLLFLFNGCALQNSRVDQYERISPLEQATEAIAATPTRFTVPAEDEVVSWNRARTFFATTLKNEGVQVDHVGNSDLRISNRESKSERFFYSVIKRRLGNGGYDFQVVVNPRLPHLEQEAALNAKNLSRFIREGELETMLLKR